MLRKSQFTPLIPMAGFASTGDELSMVVSNLFDFLTQSAWEDGSERQTGSILIFSDGGVMKAMLKDKDTGKCLWLSAPALGSLLSVADSLLVDAGADWKADKAYTGTRRSSSGRK